MKYFLTSNTNILDDYSSWDSLKKKYKVKIDDYNKILISLNNQRIVEDHDIFFNVIYLNDYIRINYKKILYQIKKIIKKNKNKKFFFFLYLQLFKNYQEDKKNKKKSLEIYKQILNFDENNTFVEILNSSNDEIFSGRNLYYLRCPFSQNELSAISEKIKSHIFKLNSKPFKLIILDCDNTLWGGVLGEEGIEGIKYLEDGDGKIYCDVQRCLLNLKKEGFILSLSSKNNEQDVWEVMKKRKMILGKKDFFSPKINWNEKYFNIDKILKELSLKEDDVLFVDDNELERKKVKKKFPNISVLEFDDLGYYLKKLIEHPRLQRFRILKEDRNKYEQYQLREKFSNLKSTKIDLDSIYLDLSQKIKFQNLNTLNISRAEQLYNKTNQFNFTANRLNKEDLKNIYNNKKFQVKLISLKDKFGDHGIIGSIIYKKINKKVYITDFLLSCRILSREVEKYIIYYVMKQSKVFEGYIGYNKTHKNYELVSNFLKNDFFSAMSSKERKKLNYYSTNHVYKVKLNSNLTNVKKFFKN